MCTYRGKPNKLDIPIFCINLDRRTDRWDNIQKQAEHLGLNITRFSAIEAKDPKFNKRPNAEGCRLSHYNCLKMAHKQNLDRIIILEDDAVFHKDFNALVKKYVNILDEHYPDWVLFGSGDYIEKFKETINQNIVFPYSFSSTVCYIYNRKNDLNFSLKAMIDKKLSCYYRGTDKVYEYLSNRGIIKYYAPREPICVQNHHDFSDLWNIENKRCYWKKTKYFVNDNYLYQLLEK